MAAVSMSQIATHSKYANKLLVVIVGCIYGNYSFQATASALGINCYISSRSVLLNNVASCTQLQNSSSLNDYTIIFYYACLSFVMLF